MKFSAERIGFGLVGLFFALLLAGLFPAGFTRPDLWASQNHAQQLAGALDRDHSIEQTFLAGRDALAAVEVVAAVPPGRFSAPYRVQVRLYRGQELLAEKTVPLADLQRQPLIRLPAPVQTDSRDAEFRLVVQSDAPPNTVSLLASQADDYLEGTLLLNGVPAARDLRFGVDAALMPAELVRSMAALAGPFLALAAWTLGLALLGAAFLWLIGWSGFERGGEAAAWSLGCGAAVSILSFIAFGLQGFWVLVLILGLGVAKLVFQRRAVLRAPRRKAEDSTSIFELTLLFFWLLILHLLQVQDLAAPLWVDGLEHVQMIERILAAGGHASGLLYHIGFHALVSQAMQGADWAGLRNFSTAQGTLVMGQWALALNPILAYPFARKILKNSRAGAFGAVLAYALFFAVPGYAFNWGRYPFLLGLSFVPLALAAGMDLSARLDLAAGKPEEAAWRSGSLWVAVGLFFLLAAAMAIAHYGTLVFVLCFGLVWLLVERPLWFARLRRDRGLQRLGAAGLLIGLALLVGLAFLRFGPGLVEEWRGQWRSLIAASVQADADQQWGDLLPLLLRGPGWLGLLAAAGGLWLVAWKDRRVLGLTVGWFGCQAGVIAIQSPFLGYALASYTNLFLAAGLPLSVLAGRAWMALEQWLKKRNMPWIMRAVSAAGVFCAVLSGLMLPGLLNSRVVLFGPQDAAAFGWIQAQLPKDEKFLVNSNFWGASQVVASDGGGWLDAEMIGQSVYFDHRPTTTEVRSFLTAHNIRYVYLGRSSGFLSPAMFDKAPFTCIYERQGIRIYQFTP